MESIDNTTSKLGYVTHLECLNCGEKYRLEKLKTEQGTTMVNICYDLCMGPLDVRYDYDALRNVLTEDELNKRPDSFWKLKELLPVEEVVVGKEIPYTPLIKSKGIGDELGIALYFKLDSAETNPTRSFKDRPVTLAFNRALEAGYENVYVASTGNLAVATAYLARETGITCRTYVPESLGEVKKDAIRHYLPHPNDLIEYDGSYDETNIQAMNDCEKANEEELKNTGRKKSFVPNSSFRPYYKEGSKTSGIEIALQLKEQIKDEVVNIVYPLGSGALLCSTYKGIGELRGLGLFDNEVRMWGAQSADCCPIIDGISTGEIIPVKNPQTLAKSIAIGNPGSGYQTLNVIKKSKGGGWKVSEKDILKSTLDLYFKEGIFSQFVGGVTLAGIIKGVQQGDLKEGSVVVANITGSGTGRIEDDLLEYGKKFGFESEAKQLLNEVK